MNSHFKSSIELVYGNINLVLSKMCNHLRFLIFFFLQIFHPTHPQRMNVLTYTNQSNKENS